MGYRGALLGAVLAIAHCGGSHSDAPSGPCQPLSGSYRVAFTQRSGNCGPIPEMIIQTNSASSGSGASACTQDLRTISPDNCRIDYDSTCPVATGGALREEGVAHGSPDGSHATATEQITVFDAAGAVLCTGDYDIGYTRL